LQGVANLASPKVLRALDNSTQLSAPPFEVDPPTSVAFWTGEAGKYLKN
jgi:hypothetical protein